MILISHRMPDVFAVCDRIVVLRRGPKVADKAIADTLARGGHRPDHRRDPRGLRSADAVKPRPLQTSVAIDDVTGLKERTVAAAPARRASPSG